jgi:CRISPR-associated protein Csb1
MDDILNRFDSWLEDAGPAALVVREYLVPVEGPDGVLFPPTFAAGDGFEGGYNIDRFPNGDICLIDSVGSQANRIEPLFAEEKYAGLVPRIVITAGNKKLNLLEAGHRAGDAIIRCTPLQAELRAAFKAVQQGDAGPLAKLAPTSIVFGAWDSRDTQAKLPRLIASTIRAFNVRKLTRSAQYVPAMDYVKSELLPEAADKVTKDAYAERGFIHVPASGSHGGVLADGGIRRDASLHLACLRLLRGGVDTRVLRRYILGLALTALTYPAGGYLRQGCHLVTDPAKPCLFQEVYGNGRRVDATVTHDEAVAYAKAAAKAFAIGEDREVEFDKELALKDISGEEPEGGKKAKRAAKAKS